MPAHLIALPVLARSGLHRPDPDLPDRRVAADALVRRRARRCRVCLSAAVLKKRGPQELLWPLLFAAGPPKTTQGPIVSARGCPCRPFDSSGEKRQLATASDRRLLGRLYRRPHGHAVRQGCRHFVRQRRLDGRLGGRFQIRSCGCGQKGTLYSGPLADQ
jgi:hypothetical protein